LARPIGEQREVARRNLGLCFHLQIARPRLDRVPW